MQVTETETKIMSIQGSESQHTKSTDVPSVWSGYNSMISDVLPLTRVGTPLTAAPAHEWPTLLTVLMQAQNIKTKVVIRRRKRSFRLIWHSTNRQRNCK